MVTNVNFSKYVADGFHKYKFNVETYLELKFGKCGTICDHYNVIPTLIFQWCLSHKNHSRIMWVLIFNPSKYTNQNVTDKQCM